MRELKPSSKLWWKKAKEVMKHEVQVSSIPALKTNDGVWVLYAQGKANLFADTFAGKCKLPQPRQNVYSECHQCPEIQRSFVFPSEKQCQDTLANLSDESSTGPDLVPAHILKSCAEQLAKPLQILLLRLLETANWPLDCPHLQEESHFFSRQLLRCPLDCRIVEGCRTLAAPNAQNTSATQLLLDQISSPT